MARKVPTAVNESAMLNNKTYLDYYYRLKEFALNVFEWHNLPDTIDERFLELALYEFGFALYFNDPIVGDLALTCMIGGELDIYRIPTYRRAYATNGYNAERGPGDSVLIFNNYLHTPTDLTIRLYAKRLYEIERTIEVNVRAQKTPVAILGDEKRMLSMKNLYMQFDGNCPVIYGDSTLDPRNVTVIKTDAPYVADKLMVLKHNVWNEALTFCGIENSNTDKRERLVADEVASNYGNIEAQRNVMLNARRQAAEKINKMFGTDISVDFRSNLQTLVNGNLVEKNHLIERTDGEPDE